MPSAGVHWVNGLSPRVRGNRYLWCGLFWVPRSIPARAGEPADERHGKRMLGVYPRACGGTPNEVFPSTFIKGLSPRVRGNPWRVTVIRISVRSIPARAGEPAALRWHRHKEQVYPRACGGTESAVLGTQELQGLSPRVRGNRHDEAVERGCRGSIPARAGEPRGLSRKVQDHQVYPRACGGTLAWHSYWSTTPGLSPRVRGNLTVLGPDGQVLGSIPARAGEPLWRGRASAQA